MKLTITKSGSIYIQKSVRSGKKVTSRTVKKLGRIQDLMKEMNMTEDEVRSWAKEQKKILEEQEATDQKSLSVTVPVTQIPDNTYPLVDTGYLFLQKVCSALRIDQICRIIAEGRQFKFDLTTIVETLIYDRILHPSSKKRAMELSRTMIEPPDFSSHEVYRALSVLASNMDFILKSLYASSNRVIKRNTDVLYYDCTNYYFEIEQEKGDLRKYGVSKENRPNPLVQMGLYMDADGIPFSMNINPGNQNEIRSVDREEVAKIKRDFGVDHFIYCSDSALAPKSLRKTLTGIPLRCDYVVTQSIKKMSKARQDWAIDPDPDQWWYYWGKNSDGKRQKFRVKFKNIDQSPDNPNIYFRSRWFRDNKADNGVYFDDRYIVTFSPKYKNYQRRLREEHVGRAEKKIKAQGNKPKKRQTDPTRLVKESYLTEEGELAENVQREIDEEKIAEEAKYDGYYCTATSLDWEEGRILGICARRFEIETCFREMKTTLEARPVYLQRDERIKAHFLICYMALLVFRILKKLLEEDFTTTEILDTLRNFRHYDLYGQGYSYAFHKTEVTDALTERLGLDFDKTVLSPAKMEKIIRDSKKEKIVAKNLKNE